MSNTQAELRCCGLCSHWKAPSAGDLAPCAIPRRLAQRYGPPRYVAGDGRNRPGRVTRDRKAPRLGLLVTDYGDGCNRFKLDSKREFSE